MKIVDDFGLFYIFRNLQKVLSIRKIYDKKKKFKYVFKYMFRIIYLLEYKKNLFKYINLKYEYTILIQVCQCRIAKFKGRPFDIFNKIDI